MMTNLRDSRPGIYNYPHQTSTGLNEPPSYGMCSKRFVLWPEQEPTSVLPSRLRPPDYNMYCDLFSNIDNVPVLSENSLLYV